MRSRKPSDTHPLRSTPLLMAGAIVDEWYPVFNREASRRVDLLLLADDKASIDARRCI